MRALVHLLSLLILVSAGTVQARTIKVATLSPAGSSWMQTMQAAADRITTDTEGRVKIRFYPGGVMGNDSAMFRKMRLGQLQGAAVAGGSLVDYFGDSQLYNMPMLFDDYAAVDYVRRHSDQAIIDGLEEAGFILFGLAEGGFAYIMSDTPIRTPADLNAKKVWVPSNDPVAQEVIQSFGIASIPLSLADVLPALQTGLVDTVATSPIGALALQWHTQIKHVTQLPLLYFYATLAVDKKAFKRLSAADQEVFRKEMTQAFADIDQQNRKDNIAALEALRSQGIQIIEPTAEEIASWDELTGRAREAQLEKGIVSRAFYQKVQGQLQEWRTAQ